MPNHHDWERADHYAEAYAQVRRELDTVRADAARVMQALDCALQMIDGLLLFLPEGQAQPPNLATLKYRLDEAIANIRRRP